MTEKNDQGLTYDQWMAQVDAAVKNIAGVSVYDLPDFNSYDEWSESVLPVESATMLLEEEGFPFEDAIAAFTAPDEEPEPPEWCAPHFPGTAAINNSRVTAALRRRRTEGTTLEVLY